jgi:cytochrome c biogenesis protein CcmG/thiol:disulfide interchange protein DsbE
MGLRAGVAAVLLALAGCGEAPPPHAAEGAEAPAFTLRALDGTEVSLAGLRGRVVVIDFWATWCAPCVVQIPILNAFWEAHRGDGVEVLGVAVDAEGAAVVGPFADEHGVRYPVLLGDEGLARDFGAFGFPTLFVVGPSGRVESMHTGVIDAEALVAAVRSARGAG